MRSRKNTALLVLEDGTEFPARSSALPVPRAEKWFFPREWSAIPNRSPIPHTKVKS